MGYREDQFFNLYTNYSTFESMKGNPRFLYPGRFAQELGGTERQLRPVKSVKRGFMTSLAYNNPTLGLNSADIETLKRRLFFQFNPTTITQSVNLTDEVMDPATQSPGNLATPVPGNQNFMFEIFLDRQMEMNSARTVSDAINSIDDDVLDPDSLFSLKPSAIGVLADLAVFYRLIGQGIDATTLKIAMELATRAKAFANEPSDASADSASTDTSAEPGSGTSTSIDQNINAGNYAFLTAIPVRVVFSSLFMVDGFVTGTTVRFTKFNANMVPIQCSVGVAMQAVYIGFARERTVFNYALEDDFVPAYENNLGASNPTSGTQLPSSGGGYTAPPAGGSKEDRDKLLEFERSILRSFRIGISKEKSVWNKNSWHSPLKIFDDAVDKDPSNYQIYRMIKDDSDEESFVTAKFGFPLVKRNENDLISRFFNEGYSFTLQYTFKGSILRTSYITEPGIEVKLAEFTGGSNLVENSNSNLVVSTKEQWERARHGGTNKLYMAPMSGILAGKDAAFLGLSSQAEWDAYKNNSKNKLRVNIVFNMSVTLSSGGTSTRRDYYRDMVYPNIPIRGSYFDFTFDTILTPNRTGTRTTAGAI